MGLSFPVVAGHYLIGMTEYTGPSYRGRSDNKAMARFVIVDVKDPANPKMVSDKNWLGFAEPPSDIFIEQYYKDIDPFQFVGCYAGAVSQFLRMGGMVPVGNRLLIQTSAVWLYGRDGQVPATEGNIWVASFTELPPGAWGGATQWDSDGDGTSIDFQAPNPNLYALPDGDKIFAQEWIAGIPLDLTIYGSNGEQIYSDSRMVEPPAVVPWTLVVFDLGAAGFDLLPGQ